jgi:hypothetical protein
MSTRSLRDNCVKGPGKLWQFEQGSVCLGEINRATMRLPTHEVWIGMRTPGECGVVMGVQESGP